jgi:putative DNA primase/helicase
LTFDRHFTENEQDKTLKDRLKTPDNLSGILNWCIRGLKSYNKYGLQIPQAVIDATEEYRQDSDKIGRFIEDCLVAMPNVNIKAGDAYKVYEKWCDDCGFGTENKTNFFADLKSKGIFKDRGTIAGKSVKNVIAGYSFDSTDASVNAALNTQERVISMNRQRKTYNDA